MDTLSCIDQIHPSVLKELQETLCNDLDKCGIYYRAFSRIKSRHSVAEKLRIKNYNNGNMLQDLFGCRVVLYFKDDISLCTQIIGNRFQVDNISQDDEKEEVFSPMRLNYVCRLPDHFLPQIPIEIWNLFPIDKTFEIQLRTIFSEGWHEVEHDLRYKCQDSWEGNKDLSRYLNGIFATLETCDYSILNIFDQLSYRKYKDKDWEAMIRNKLRIRLTNDEIDFRISDILSNSNDLAKEFLRVDREGLLSFLSDINVFNIPRSINNIIFVINELFINNQDLHNFAPQKLKELVDAYKLRH